MKKLVWLVVMLLGVVGLGGCGGSASKTSADAVAAFKAAGLECESTRAMTPKDYGMAPMTAKEGVRFFIPSMGEDKGGRIMSFDNQEDLQKTKAYYDEMGKGSAMLFSWTFAKENILVQINGQLEPEKAKKYEAALVAMK